MEISQHIKNLLKTKERVILGGFGAFTTKHISAKIDTVTKEMRPPFKIVVFDQNLTEDAGLLIKYMADQEKISPDNAKEQISEYVKTVKTRLESGKTVEFIDLGTFKQSSSGNIEFSFLSQDNLLLDSFGLPVVSLAEQDNIVSQPVEQKRPVKQRSVKKEKPVSEKPIKKVETVKEKPPVTEKPPVKETPVVTDKPVVKEKPVKEKPVKQRPVKQKKVKQKPVKKQRPVKEKPVGEKPKKKRRWLAFVIPILAIGIMLAALYFLKPDLWDTYIAKNYNVVKGKVVSLFEGKESGKFDVIENVDTTTTEQEIDTAAIAVDTATSEMTEEDLAITDENVAEEDPIEEETTEVVVNNQTTDAKRGKYYIIVSSVKDEASAKDEQKRFTSKGITTNIVYAASVKRYRLSMGEFNSARDAQKYFEEMEQKHGKISAWVWEKK